ncbi:hypothetical protein [Curtobacterium flaccumfaciens]|uniref:hypothetical protein n=1 Tax=Curtobacterium flaccumfaciens TaxID=2035 RepID=UPI0013677429|nr:hypothetical protein [Curtobacterium flaccumfaciens]MBT1665669.1 hypothetical protein [Curtobacterium flaccumfaciens pv. flaccumfaciens]QFS80040.2 hypothetical protein GBG65_13020 [Curtobacterium flaccumfaciens pv. flaccumfaciens]
MVMTENQEAAALPDGVDVHVITYDREGNEVRRLPAALEDDDIRTWSKDFGIGRGKRRIERLKHGPLIATDTHLREVNVGSLGRAVSGNEHGTELYVDHSAPPVDEDLLEEDERYVIRVEEDDSVTAVVTLRFPAQPPQTTAEIEVAVSRIAVAYDCHINGVRFLLPGGTPPEELLQTRPDSEEWATEIRAEIAANIATTAHDVSVIVATDAATTMATLMDGAAAVADFLNATQGGPLDATGVLNLLRAGHFNALVGEQESSYLEVKAAMHAIWAAGQGGVKAKIELAQDVARFANGDVDAILVFGYREAAGDGNAIGSLTPVLASLLNIDQIQEVLDARIVPPIDGLLIESFPTSAKESVLAMMVPRQPREMQPYLVQGAITEGKVEGAFFSIVRRRGEGSITTSAQQIHAYIVAGKRYLRGDE